jgi:hypothetical protein
LDDGHAQAGDLPHHSFDPFVFVDPLLDLLHHLFGDMNCPGFVVDFEREDVRPVRLSVCAFTVRFATPSIDGAQGGGDEGTACRQLFEFGGSTLVETRHRAPFCFLQDYPLIRSCQPRSLCEEKKFNCGMD